MDLSEENQNAAKFLVPEMVRRSRTVASVKKGSKHASPHVDKVYLSKKRYLEKIKNEYRILKDTCAAQKQQRASVALKQKATMSHFTFTIQKSNHLNEVSAKLDDQYELLLAEYEKAMQEIDDCYTQSVKNFTDENLPGLTEIVAVEISELQASIEAIKLNEQSSNDEEEPNVGVLNEILKSRDSIEEKYQMAVKENEQLLLELAELEKQLACL